MSWAVLEKIGLHFIQRLVTQGNVKIGKFLNMVQSRPLFVYFRPFHITIQIEKTERRCCVWDSNSEPQNGKCRWIHWAMPPPKKKFPTTRCPHTEGGLCRAKNLKGQKLVDQFPRVRPLEALFNLDGSVVRNYSGHAKLSDWPEHHLNSNLSYKT